MNIYPKIRNILMTAVTAATILALSACGGGAPHTTNLELVSHSPSAGATGVLLADAIELNFSEAVSPQSVTANTLKVLDGSNELSYDKSFSNGNKTITLTLTSAPANLPANLTVAINGVASGNGASLTASFDFTTADDWVELDSYVQEDSSADADVPSVAVDKDGNLVVAYVSGESAGYFIAVRRWNGNTWKSIGKPFNGSGKSGAASPNLALDKDGNPVVAFQQYTSADKNNVYVRHWDGGAWSAYGPTGPIDLSKADDTTNPRISISNNGDPILAFIEKSNYNSKIARHLYYGAFKISSSIWKIPTTPVNIDASKDITVIDSASGANSGTVITWVEKTGTGSYNVYTKNITTGSQYGSAAVATSSKYVAQIFVELGKDDSPVVVWHEQGSNKVQARYWDSSNNTWKYYGQSPVVSTATMAALAVDSNGYPVIAVNTAGSVTGSVELKVIRWNGSAWVSLPDYVNLNPANELYNFDIAVGRGNNPVVVWSEDDDGNYMLHAKVYNGLAR